MFIQDQPVGMSPRVIYPPSGRDRRLYTAATRKTEQTFERVTGEAAAAQAAADRAAHRRDCAA